MGCGAGLEADQDIQRVLRLAFGRFHDRPGHGVPIKAHPELSLYQSLDRSITVQDELALHCIPSDPMLRDSMNCQESTPQGPSFAHRLTHKNSFTESALSTRHASQASVQP